MIRFFNMIFESFLADCLTERLRQRRLLVMHDPEPRFCEIVVGLADKHTQVLECDGDLPESRPLSSPIAAASCSQQPLAGIRRNNDVIRTWDSSIRRPGSPRSQRFRRSRQGNTMFSRGGPLPESAGIPWGPCSGAAVLHLGQAVRLHLNRGELLFSEPL